MKKTITRYEDVSDDSMVGGEGWGNYDPQASTDKFIGLIEAAIKAEYPEYSLEIITVNDRNRTELSDEYDEDSDLTPKDIESIKDDIFNIVSNIHQSWDKWLVEAETEEL